MTLVGGIPRSINPNSRVKGFDIVLSNLNKEIRAIEGRAMIGLLKAAAMVRKDMDHTPPLIPIDTGTLRASWFAMPLDKSAFPGNYGPVVKCGFKADYALYPHEMLNPDINWTRANSGPKFFEYAVKRNRDAVLRIIRDNVIIK
jgi:hypothetical protein